MRWTQTLPSVFQPGHGSGLQGSLELLLLDNEEGWKLESCFCPGVPPVLLCQDQGHNQWLLHGQTDLV